MNDLLGKTLLNRQIEAYSKNHTEKINLPISLQRGFHYVTIVNNDTNEVTTKKVMIMN